MDTPRVETSPGRPTLPPCPQCERDDLVPYGNGSKWICRTCRFLAPCCEPDVPCRW
ncbi:hypothetical protein [Gandjariella thermophila]|uniref:hypothetical protein n=1 Tax=Gandjariella thermophila TaxID=1931992 RepID=UPI00129BF708|nr:hypothetical protein [Gandjariella thermophila]